MKHKQWIKRIPKPVKAGFCVVGIILLTGILYITTGCPTLTMKQEFRRAEKVHLVGPSTIVHNMKSQYQEFDKMIVGETEHGVCFFGRYYNSYPYGDPFAEPQYLFTYREKSGDLSIHAAPNIWGRFWRYERDTLPVYLFDEYPQASRAELELAVAYVTSPAEMSSSNAVEFQEHFHQTANRIGDGFFLFWLNSKSTSGHTAMRLLSEITSGTLIMSASDAKTVITATVQLYDPQGELIVEEVLEIRP